jgi:hypothetical protein
MAKSAATWEGRRALTDNPSTSQDNYRSAARQLMDMGLLSEAALFFARAEDDEGLMAIIEQAMAEGNFFVFQAAASRLKNREVGRDQVQSLLAAAEKNGRLLYAEKATAWLNENR